MPGPRLVAPRRHVRDARGVVHVARETAGEHHLTVCARYLRGPLLPERITSSCVSCSVRLDAGHVLERDPPAGETPPAAVLRGRGTRGRGTRGRVRVDPKGFTAGRAE